MDAAVALTILVAGVALLVGPQLNRESKPLRAALVMLSLAISARYAFWRATSTLPPLSPRWDSVVAYGFFILEMTTMYLAIGDVKLLKLTSNRSREADENLSWFGSQFPRIDVLIPTYNESWEVLEKTLVGIAAQDYPNFHVWVLDDGRREWLRRKLEGWPATYVTRSTNEHYKAGNLNNGIREIEATGVVVEYFAILDADFVAREGFLRRTLALMHAPDVGIVQTPQFFYNPDPYQRAFGGVHTVPDEQRSWFDIYLPALDRLGAASCCGTSCLVRAKALASIGGLPTESICEDTLSTIKMRKAGWKTVLLHERLSVGLAPEGISEFLNQRARWLVGGVQNSRYAGPGKGWRQRFRHWLMLWRMALFGFLRPGWIIIAIIYSITGIWIVRGSNYNEAASYFAPVWLDRFFMAWLFAGRRLPGIVDAQWMLLFPMWIEQTFRAMLGKPMRFAVTAKDVRRDRVVIHWGYIKYQLALGAALLASILYSVLDPRAPAYADGLLHVNTVVSLFFLLLLIVGALPAIEPPQRRRADRFACKASFAVINGGEIQHWEGHDISIDGIAVKTSGLPPEEVRVCVEGLWIEARLVRRDGDRVAFRFDESARHDLIRKLYCANDYIEAPKTWSLRVALWACARKLLWT